MSDEVPEVEHAITFTTVKVPIKLARLQSQCGVHHAGRKFVAYGDDGSGKSYMLASMPHPILAVAAGGENGIQQYLDESLGDMCFEVSAPGDHDAVIDFVEANMDRFKSFAVDPINLLWEEHMDSWEEELGHEIKGPNWKVVKKPWHTNLKRLMRSPLHVGFAAHLKDVEYREEESQSPGVKGKLTILQVDAPKLEKRVPYTVDFIFRCQKVLNKDLTPSGKHKVIVYKARRPRSVAPKDLYIGKEWIFDGKKPKDGDPWATIIAPFDKNWDEGAVDFLGIDPRKVEESETAWNVETKDAEVGRVIKLMQAQTNLKDYQYNVFPDEIRPVYDRLDTARQQIIEREHEVTKARLGKEK